MLCIYPKTIDPNALRPELLKHNINSPPVDMNNSSIPFYRFSGVSFNPRIISLMNNNFNGKKIILAFINENDAGPIFQSVSGSFRRFLEGNTLDLTNLKQKGVDIKDNRNLVYAVFCILTLLLGGNDIDSSPIEVVKCENMERSMNFLKYYFPKAKIENNNQAGGGGSNNHGESSTQSSVPSLYQKVLMSSIKVKPVLPPKPLPVNQTFDLTESYERAELDDFEPIMIDPQAYPTNWFFIEFFDCAWQKIGEIGKFYAENAVFSISIDDCPQQSKLYKYIEQSTNYFESRVNTIFGKGSIAMKQKELFNSGLFAHPTDIHSSLIGEGLFGTVISGVFQDKNGCLFGFDRSFVVCNVEDEMFILNDHIFIRNVNHKKLSGFTPEDAASALNSINILKQD